MRWISRTFAGWVVGFVLALACIVAVDSLGVGGLQSPLAVGMGLGVGAFQRRAVSPFIGPGSAWIAATTIGLALPFALADALKAAGAGVPYALAPYVAAGGVLAAALQWRLLRAAGVPAPGWWLAITPTGWIAGASTVWLVEWLPRWAGLLGAARYLSVVLSGGLPLGVAAALAWRLMDRVGASRGRSGRADH